ncbi:MAG: hypothetical protein ACK52I_23275 [Pseudomonadota bacterium]|jgi:flagellar biosynthesis/type III secretory pathway protein FliH
MKFNEYWAAFCLKAATKGVDVTDPQQEVAYKMEGLHRQLKGAFEQSQKQGHFDGFKLGFEAGKKAQEQAQAKRKSALDNLFDGLFGGPN